jgi:hypothetical protein
MAKRLKGVCVASDLEDFGPNAANRLIQKAETFELSLNPF